MKKWYLKGQGGGMWATHLVTYTRGPGFEPWPGIKNDHIWFTRKETIIHWLSLFKGKKIFAWIGLKNKAEFYNSKQNKKRLL